MPATPTFPFTKVDSIAKWSNFHHTIAERPVPLYLTPDALLTATSGPLPPSAERQAQALSAILDYCLTAKPPERLCTLGATWSLSNVLDPANVVLDPGAFNKLAKVDPSWLTKDYRDAAAPRGGVPVIAQGGTNIGYLNQKLGESGLALQTSGANDGHRLAGCIATGTHGSALGIGAVHDSVLAIYLVTAPGKAVLLQPTTRSFSGELAAWFEKSTRLATLDVANDEMFHAAQVALGSLGFVHSVVLEAVPLYQLRGRLIERPLTDPAIWKAMETLDTSALDPGGVPYHFSVVISPYATGTQSGAFATLLWKQLPAGHFAPPSPGTALAATDTTRVLAALTHVLAGGLAGLLVEHILASVTAQQFKSRAIEPLFPGQMFGPTNLPPGNGRSTEVVVDHANTGAALRAILGALRAEADAGRYLLGALGVRFVPATRALLGMNVHAMNTFIEIPSVGSPDLSAVHRACWTALSDAKVPYTCHWGQEYGMDAAGVAAYYGSRAVIWKKARESLLATPEARAVFSTPQLVKLGLG